MDAVLSRSVVSRLTGLAGAVALACGLVLVPASSPANAQAPLDVRCTGTFTAGLTPAVTAPLQPQAVNYAAQYTYATCNGAVPSGSSAFTISSTATCYAERYVPFDEIITWSDRSTSTVRWGIAVGPLAGGTFTGMVTAGRYEGAAATKIALPLDYTGATSVQCAFGEGAISGAGGSAVLALTSP
ncbi:hypothetical protein [Streptomyces sp. SUK 48]|uniref:hypothetical protein n=1 Tax=Streptomyces sp. SUK 48 TaxID=2582831 RepID=UPI00129B2654|nr:hypothetical protein [Streptomyces sp. SUK 48]